MSTTVSQTLQKLHFTILGVPMDVQMQDAFVKKIEAEGYGWLNSIINDYLGFLANTSSHASVINMLDGCALSLPIHEAGELPSSLMVWQGPMKDDAILNISLAIEAALSAS